VWRESLRGRDQRERAVRGARDERALPPQKKPMHSATGRRTAAGSIVSSFLGPLNFQDLYNGVDLEHFWNYEGSFTTPPCTEAVDFYIMMDPAPISQVQLDKFKLAIGWKNGGGNFRPPQPLAGRTVAGCRTVGSTTPSKAPPTPTFKTVQCPNQTAALVLQAVTGVLCVFILAATCLGPVRRTLMASSSARQVKFTDDAPARVQQMVEDLKILELDMGTLKDAGEANGKEIAKMQDLVRQIRNQVLQSQDAAPFWHHAELSR